MKPHHVDLNSPDCSSSMLQMIQPNDNYTMYKMQKITTDLIDLPVPPRNHHFQSDPLINKVNHDNPLLQQYILLNIVGLFLVEKK